MEFHEKRFFRKYSFKSRAGYKKFQKQFEFYFKGTKFKIKIVFIWRQYQNLKKHL